MPSRSQKVRIHPQPQVVGSATESVGSDRDVEEEQQHGERQWELEPEPEPEPTPPVQGEEDGQRGCCGPCLKCCCRKFREWLRQSLNVTGDGQAVFFLASAFVAQAASMATVFAVGSEEAVVAVWLAVLFVTVCCVGSSQLHRSCKRVHRRKAQVYSQAQPVQQDTQSREASLAKTVPDDNLESVAGISNKEPEGQLRAWLSSRRVPELVLERIIFALKEAGYHPNEWMPTLQSMFEDEFAEFIAEAETAANEAKQQLATIYDPFGKVLGKIKSKYDGIVIGHTQAPLVNRGDAISHVARIMSEAPNTNWGVPGAVDT